MLVTAIATGVQCLLRAGHPYTNFSISALNDRNFHLFWLGFQRPLLKSNILREVFPNPSRGNLALPVHCKARAMLESLVHTNGQDEVRC